MRIEVVYILGLLWSMCASVDAQVNTFRSVLPQEGDVFYYKLDNLPDNLIPTGAEIRSVWNLSALSAPTAHEVTFQSGRKGAFSSFFPSAELVSTDIWRNETYYEKYGSGLFVIGEVIRNDSNNQNVIVKKYSDPKPIYNEFYTIDEPQEYQAQYEIMLNANEVKNYHSSSNDLIKVEVTESISEEAKSAGVIFLPRARFNDSYLLQRHVKSEVNISIKKGQEPWSQATDINVSDLPLKILKENREMIFMSEDSEERLAQINISDDGVVENVLFKSHKEQVLKGDGYENETFFMYPNPSFGLVRLDFINLTQGTYQLDVYNIIGKRLWSQSYDVSGYTTIKEDLGFLSKGTYLYTISNSHGEKLFTRKMAIINP